MGDTHRVQGAAGHSCWGQEGAKAASNGRGNSQQREGGVKTQGVVNKPQKEVRQAPHVGL